MNCVARSDLFVLSLMMVGCRRLCLSFQAPSVLSDSHSRAPDLATGLGR